MTYRTSTLLREAEELGGRWLDPDKRFLDMAVQFREVDRIDGKLVPTGRVSKVYGGRWDYLAITEDGTLGNWSKQKPDPKNISVDDVSPIQFEALTEDEAYHIVLLGSRRSSKTESGARWLKKQICRWPKKSLSVLVEKRDKARKLSERKLLPLLPIEWIHKIRRESDRYSIEFQNGCIVNFLSGKVPDDARGDGIPAALVDERQIINPEATENLHLSTSEGGEDFQTFETATALAGLFEEYWRKCQKSERHHCIELSITDNIFLEASHDEITGIQLPEFIKSARAIMDPVRFEREIGRFDGERFIPQFTTATGRVYWPFDSYRHIHDFSEQTAQQIVQGLFKTKDPAVGRDITRQITARRFRGKLSRSLPYLAGLDFNIAPMVAVIYKIFSTPGTTPDLLWAIDEVVLESEADPTRMGLELKNRGYRDLGIIPDASGGVAAFRLLRDEGFIVRTSGHNPFISDRINAVLAKLLNAADQTTLIFAPQAKRTIQAFSSQNYDAWNRPEKGTWDHYTDAAGYPIAYLYPAAIKRLEKQAA